MGNATPSRASWRSSGLSSRRRVEGRTRAIAVENGGEVALAGSADFVIGVKVGGRVLFALKIVPKDVPIGIVTSSRKYGHALSFRETDSVTVVAETTGSADAAATAICNAAKGKDTVERGLMKAKEVKGVKGVIIVLRA